MTKEEAVQYLEDYCKMYADIAPERFLEALEIVLSKPSLPSNLFEAKHAFSEKRFPNEKKAPLRRAARIGYEAGAEWMAEQGVSMTITDDTEWTDVDKFVHSNCDGASIIQIRKKNGSA